MVVDTTVWVVLASRSMTTPVDTLLVETAAPADAPIASQRPTELEVRPTESLVEVVELGDVLPHPNPESTQLEVTTVFSDYPCVLRKGEYKRGQRVVYIPVDSLVPVDRPYFSFLASASKPRQFERIKAKKLKGFFSMGLVIALPPEFADAAVGTDLTAALGVQKYEPDVPTGTGAYNGNQVKVPQEIPVYGVEGYRKYGKAMEQLCASSEIIVTEKYEGQNWRAAYLSKQDKVIVGTHRTFRDPAFQGPTAYHTYVFQRYALAERLRAHPDIAIYGEVYGTPIGACKQLTYGARSKNGAVDEHTKLRVFDALNLKTMRWLDYDDFANLAQNLGLPTAAVLYRGPFDADLIRSLADGQSTEGAHIREGVVIGTTTEGRLPNGVRQKLKLVSEAFLLLKN